MPLVATFAAIVMVEFQRRQAALYCAAGLGVALALIVDTIVILIMHERRMAQESARVPQMGEIIEVFDAPLPTKTHSSPWPKTQPRSRARRKGRTRVRVHKRWATHMYNPQLAGHCAYQAVLQAAKWTQAYPLSCGLDKGCLT